MLSISDIHCLEQVTHAAGQHVVTRAVLCFAAAGCVRHHGPAHLHSAAQGARLHHTRGCGCRHRCATQCTRQPFLCFRVVSCVLRETGLLSGRGVACLPACLHACMHQLLGCCIPAMTAFRIAPFDSLDSILMSPMHVCCVLPHCFVLCVVSPPPGPVDAAYKAIDGLVRVDAELVDYSVNSVTEGIQVGDS